MFPTVDAARRVEAALGADDDAFSKTRRDGAAVVLEFEAPNPRSLLRAVDDALACAAAAEDVITTSSIGADDA